MFENLYRKIVSRKLSALQDSRIQIVENGERVEFGQADSRELVEIHIHDPRFYQRVVFGGGLGAAESLMDGDWTCDDLTALVRIFARNIHLGDRLNGGFGLFKKLAEQLLYRWKRNSIEQAKQNIHEHYDLGNDFFKEFLDPTMNYSAGVFQSPDDTMLLASINKMWRVCRKLDLSPSDHLLEIGTGWGSLAVFAATQFGCRVTTTTISEEQYLYAKSRVRALGLEDQVTVVKQDYRQLEGKFDKIVSIEMIEAVGHEYLQSFFAKCNDLMSANGMMLVQSIVIRDQRHRAHLNNTDFIKKYIFPGGCLPSNLSLLQNIERVSDLQMLNVEDIGMDYAQTIAHWKDRFLENLDKIRDIGFRDDRFIRMWHYYLCYCQAGFLERQISNVQLLVAMRDSRSIPTPASWELNPRELRRLAANWVGNFAEGGEATLGEVDETASLTLASNR